jgi:hypothetical protein
VGLERGPLSVVSTTEELLGRNSSGSGLENRKYGRGDPLRWPRDSVYPQKLALTSQTSGGRSVGVVRLPAEATEFVCSFVFFPPCLYKGSEMSVTLLLFNSRNEIELYPLGIVYKIYMYRCTFHHTNRISCGCTMISSWPCAITCKRMVCVEVQLNICLTSR